MGFVRWLTLAVLKTWGIAVRILHGATCKIEVMPLSVSEEDEAIFMIVMPVRLECHSRG